MSGVQGHVLGHLVRRGLSVAQESLERHEIVQKLQHDANMPDHVELELELSTLEMSLLAITFITFMLIIASTRYTLGEVVASLAMVETPTTTAIVEDKPPAYTDEPDAPLEKETPIVREADADVEVMLIKNKLITRNIGTTVLHISSIGGYFARWRGLVASFVYHFNHGLFANLIVGLLGLGMVGHAITYVFVSVALARLHMAWTHSMIAYPSKKPFWRRVVPFKRCKALLLPSFVFAAAQQATFLLPLGVALALRVTPDDLAYRGIAKDIAEKNCHMLASTGLRILAVISTAVFVAFAVLLPAAVTLTRIEAALLPEGEDTIVPFDRQAILGDIDLTVRGGCKAVFVQAWRSFDFAARWRLIKLYAKIALIQTFQFAMFAVTMYLMLAELIGTEKLVGSIKSAGAQFQLAAMGVEQNGTVN